MNPTFSVIILCQPAESAVTALTLHHLARDLDGSGSVHVLMNGGFVGHLRTMAPDSPKISYYSSPTNLGVAGGRNFLLRLPEVQDCDVIVVLDNDVITPPGHIERMIAALVADERAGVVGPAVLHLPAVARDLGLERRRRLARADHQRSPLTASAGGFANQRSGSTSAPTRTGAPATSTNCRSSSSSSRRAGGSTDPFYAMNHEDPSIRSAIADGSTALIPAANVAGCCQVFRRELLDEVGYLMDEFSPYGYEDVDFCIRVADIRAAELHRPDASSCSTAPIGGTATGGRLNG